MEVDDILEQVDILEYISQYGLAAKPNIEFEVITTLFAPDEQCITSILPLVSLPAIIPT